MSENTEVISCEVSSIDFAALLIAMGFELVDTSVIETVSLDSITAPKDRYTGSVWHFKTNGLNGSVNAVKGRWKLPTRLSTDAVELARLLAHNLSALKHAAIDKKEFRVRDLGGIGMIDNSGEWVRMNTYLRFGGTCDTATAALAITLGCKPAMCYVKGGKFYTVFDDSDPSQLRLEDIKRMMADPNMRREDNNTWMATLVCMLDNRAYILDNLHTIRRKLRITADGGMTQALVDKDMDEKTKRALDRHFN